MGKKKDPSQKENTQTPNTKGKKPTKKPIIKTEVTPKKDVNFNSKVMTIKENGVDKTIPLNNKQIAELLYGNKLNIRGKNKKQKEFLTEIGLKEITIAVGAAGTGKSFVSIAKALELLTCPDNNYQKIYIVTPTQVVDNQDVGFLPGDLNDKLMYFLLSSYFIIDKIIGKKNREKLLELDIITPLSLAHIRGLSLDSCIVIGEELQNTSVLQFKTILTRIGYSCKMILSGDLEQIDRKDGALNGLQHAIENLVDIDEIGIIKFGREDIVRNPLIEKMLNKY